MWSSAELNAAKTKKYTKTHRERGNSMESTTRTQFWKCMINKSLTLGVYAFIQFDVCWSLVGHFHGKCTETIIKYITVDNVAVFFLSFSLSRRSLRKKKAISKKNNFYSGAFSLLTASYLALNGDYSVCSKRKFSLHSWESIRSSKRRRFYRFFFVRRFYCFDTSYRYLFSLQMARPPVIFISVQII